MAGFVFCIATGTADMRNQVFQLLFICLYIAVYCVHFSFVGRCLVPIDTTFFFFDIDARKKTVLLNLLNVGRR